MPVRSLERPGTPLSPAGLLTLHVQNDRMQHMMHNVQMHITACSTGQQALDPAGLLTLHAFKHDTLYKHARRARRFTPPCLLWTPATLRAWSCAAACCTRRCGTRTWWASRCWCWQTSRRATPQQLNKRLQLATCLQQALALTPTFQLGNVCIIFESLGSLQLAAGKVLLA